MNDVTFTTSSNGNQRAQHPSGSARRLAKGSWIVGVAILSLGACAGADDASTDELLLGEHEQALTDEQRSVAEASSAVGDIAFAEGASKAVRDDLSEVRVAERGTMTREYDIDGMRNCDHMCFTEFGTSHPSFVMCQDLCLCVWYDDKNIYQCIAEILNENASSLER
jgi:hypothetical protein